MYPVELSKENQRANVIRRQKNTFKSVVLANRKDAVVDEGSLEFERERERERKRERERERIQERRIKRKFERPRGSKKKKKEKERGQRTCHALLCSAESQGAGLTRRHAARSTCPPWSQV